MLDATSLLSNHSDLHRGRNGDNIVGWLGDEDKYSGMGINYCPREAL